LAPGLPGRSMAPRRPRGATLRFAPGLVCALACAAAALGLLVVGPSFTGGPLPLQAGCSAAPRGTAKHLAAEPRPSRCHASASAQSTWGSTALAWQCLGSALLLWSCRKASAPAGTRPAARWSLGHGAPVYVGLKTVATPPQTPSEGDAVASTASPRELSQDCPAQPVETLVSLDSAPTSDTVAAPCQGLSEAARATRSCRPAQHAKPARLAGGMRVQWSRHRNASRPPRSAARASRRSVGARLRPASEHPEPQVAFDPSRQRTKIQDGLRVLGHMNSENAREGKMASITLGLTDESDVVMAEQRQHSRYRD